MSDHIHQSDGSTANPSRLRCKDCGEMYSYDTNVANSLRSTPTCGHSGVEWNEHGECITCARDRVLGEDHDTNVTIPSESMQEWKK